MRLFMYGVVELLDLSVCTQGLDGMERRSCFEPVMLRELQPSSKGLSVGGLAVWLTVGPHGKAGPGKCAWPTF